MSRQTRTLSALLMAGSTLMAGAGALAQSTSSDSSGSNWYRAGNSYFGLNVGRTDFSLGGGTGVFSNDNRDTSYKLSSGTYFDRNLGMELGYTHFGNVGRGGGQTRAEAVNLSAIGRIPLGASFNLLGQIGASYGRTRVSSQAGSGITSGRENGFGLNLGLGAEYVFNPQMSVVLQYERHDLQFAGGGRDTVGNTSLGLRFRF